MAYSESDAREYRRELLRLRLLKAQEIIQKRQDLIDEKEEIEKQIEDVDQEIDKIKNANWLDRIRLGGIYITHSQNQESDLSYIEERKDMLLSEKDELEQEILFLEESGEIEDNLVFIPEIYWDSDCIGAFIDILESGRADNLADIYRVYDDMQLTARIENEYKAKYEAVKKIVQQASTDLDKAETASVGNSL